MSVTGKFDTDIAALLYGDYPHLTDRCLRPLTKLRDAGVDVRVYANEPSDGSMAAAAELGFSPSVFTPQIYKYPVLRKAIASARSKFFMWFDDDSFIRADDPAGWLKKLELVAKHTGADLLGSVYTINLSPDQIAWAKTRPWYRGLPIKPSPAFVTGGWWMARTDFLRRLGWPDQQLRHNGGDVMLGLACHQAGAKIVHFRDGVGINASYPEGEESKHGRRGFSERPAGRRGWKASHEGKED